MQAWCEICMFDVVWVKWAVMKYDVAVGVVVWVHCCMMWVCECRSRGVGVKYRCRSRGLWWCDIYTVCECGQ